MRGKHPAKCARLSNARRGVALHAMRRARLAMILAAILAVPGCARAQAPGTAAFRVYENDRPVGSLEMTLSATEDGWRLQGTSRIEGAVPVVIPNLDLHYDENWGGRFMTLEMKAPDDAILHIAVVGTVTRTDIVRATEARFQSSSVSPDTIFLPDRAYGAYEAMAVRLDGAVEGDDLPIFIAPVGETRARVDAVVGERVRTGSGSLESSHYSLTEFRDRPTPVELWADRGRLLRVDFPRSGVSVVRTDVIR